LFLKVALIENLFEEKTNHLFFVHTGYENAWKKRSWVYCFDTTDTQGSSSTFTSLCVFRFGTSSWPYFSSRGGSTSETE
jgi:hypothetical protein